MKRKLLIAAGVLVALVIVAIIALSILVKTYLKSEQLKAIIIPRAEEFTHRKVSIDRIDVSLFKGIVVKKLDVREENRDFVSMEEFVLDYDLWPLLRKELVISKVALISPRIHIRRLKDGTFNFSDMLGKPEEKKEAAKKEEGGLPVSLVTDRVLLKDANLEFVDEMKELPDISAVTDADFKLSLKDKISAEGYLDLKKLDASLGGIKTSTSGKVDIKKDLITADVTSTVDGKPIGLKATVKDYSGSPDIEFALKADEVDANKLMALTGGGKKQKKGNGETAKEASAAPTSKPESEKKPMKIKATGTADIKTARYGEYTLTDLSLDAGAAVEVTSSENSVTGEVDLRKFSASMQGMKVSANGKITLSHDMVKTALNTTVDVAETYTHKEYTLEKARIDASPKLTYSTSKKDLAGSLGIKELRAASVRGKDFSITGLELSGDADVAYNVPSGNMNVNADIKRLQTNYNGVALSASGKLSYDGDTATAVLKGASVKASEYKSGEHVVRNLDLLADTNLKIPLKTKEPLGSAEIKSLKANVDGITLSASGAVNTDGKIARAAFKELTAKADEYVYDTYEMKGLSLSAATDMKIDLKEKLPAGGTVDLKEFKANVNGVDLAASGKVNADAAKLAADLNVNVDKDAIKLSATAQDYRTAPDVKFDVYSKKLDINRLRAISGPEKSEATPGGAAAPASAPEKKEKPKKLTAHGTVKIDRADYEDYMIEGLSAAISYVNDVMTVDPMKMTLKGGKTMVIDGAFLGNVNFKYPRDAADSSEIMKQTMSGKGAAKFTKIQIKDVKVARVIAKLTSLEELNNPTFTNSELNYVIKDRKVNLDGFMKSDRINVVPAGYVGLDKAIDMEINLNLDPVLARRLVISQFIKESDGSSTIPLIVKGTADDPKVSVNAQKVIKKEVDKGIKKLFDNIIPQKKEEAPTTTQPTAPPAEQQQQQPPAEEKPKDQIKQLFKGIFGK